MPYTAAVIAVSHLVRVADVVLTGIRTLDLMHSWQSCYDLTTEAGQP